MRNNINNLSFYSIVALLCFSLINLNCTELATTTTQPKPSSQNENNKEVAYIETLNLYAAQAEYKACVENNLKCEEEKKHMQIFEKVARGGGIPIPIPLPPNPLSPTRELRRSWIYRTIDLSC